MSHVPGLPFPSSVFEDYIRGLEDFDRKWMGTVLANGLQESGQKGSPNDLEFKCLRVGDFDGSVAVVLAV